MFLRRLKSLPDQIDVVLRGFDSRGRLFLKTVQNINSITKTNGINGAIGVRIEVLNQLKDSGTTKAFQWFCIWVLLVALGQIKSVAKNVLYIAGICLRSFLLLLTHRSGFLVLM